MTGRVPRAFSMVRGADESGVSGTGKVLEGAVFSDDTTVVRWLTKDMPSSTAIYPSYKAFTRIHIDSHPNNKTRVVWHDKPHIGEVHTYGSVAGDLTF
jgi:hypothetical protein